MNTQEIYERVYGGLVAAVAGDAMGSATEQLTRQSIRKIYGVLDTFVDPDESPFSHGHKAGEYTDDSSQLILLAERLLQVGAVSAQVVAEMLVDWAGDPEMPSENIGPSTQEAIGKLRDGVSPWESGLGNPQAHSGASNGAVMKIAPAGWFFPGDVTNAMRAAIPICAPTHFTTQGVAGATAVAGAIAACFLPGATENEICSVALYGSRFGAEESARRGARQIPGATVDGRLRTALSIAAESTGVWDAMESIGDVVGSGLPTNETVGAAFGLFASARGNVRDSVVAAVNMGDDTDTVACIVGAIAGTFKGIDGVPSEWVSIVERANDLDLSALAQRIADFLQDGTRLDIRLD